MPWGTIVNVAAVIAGSLVGMLHLSLDVSLITDLLQAVDTSSGYIELRQVDGSKILLLGAAGPKQQGGKPVQASVPDTRWTVAYWPAQTGILASRQPGSSGGVPGWTLGAGGAVLAGGLLLFMLARRKRSSCPKYRTLSRMPLTVEVLSARLR